jgi:hypothetical protein
MPRTNRKPRHVRHRTRFPDITPPPHTHPHTHTHTTPAHTHSTPLRTLYLGCRARHLVASVLSHQAEAAYHHHRAHNDAALLWYHLVARDAPTAHTVRLSTPTGTYLLSRTTDHQPDGRTHTHYTLSEVLF